MYLKQSKQLIESKTFWTGLATICTGIGLFVAGEQNLQELLISVIGCVFIVLRIFTEKGIE